MVEYNKIIKKMRGNILKRILEFLEEGAVNQVLFFQAIIESGYGANMGKIEYYQNRNKENYESSRRQNKEIKIKKIKLQKFLYKLKKDGLVSESKSGSSLSITKLGRKKLLNLKESNNKFYLKQESENVIIVSFDIPEKLRKKRNWLREVIQNLGFKMVHKSVWIGKIKIPKELIRELGNKNMVEYVEIFEISKTGSLENLLEK